MSALTIDMTGMPAVQEIQAPLHLIREPENARPIDQDHAANLAVSMSEIGLENAVSLRVLRVDELNDDGCVWMRTRGGHRCAGARMLGWYAIAAKVRTEAVEIARLAEIDENLLHRDYTALERAQALAERLEAWAAAHPDRVVNVNGQTRGKRGRPEKWDKLSHFSNGTPPTMGFAEGAALVSGISRKTVARALTVYRAIPPSQQARLHGTWIAGNDAALRQLAGIGEAEEQAKVIDLMLAGKTKNVAEARALAAGVVPAAKTAPSNTVQRDFEKAWKAATPSQRDALLHWLAGQRLPQGWTVIQQGEG